MADFQTFCKRYELDPTTDDAREQYQAARDALATLHGAAAKAETANVLESL